MVNVLFVNWVYCFEIARNGNFLALSFSKMAPVSLNKSLMRMYLLMSVVYLCSMHKRETTKKHWSLLCGDHCLPLRNVTILYEPLPELLKYQTWLHFCSLTDLYRFFRNNVTSWRLWLGYRVLVHGLFWFKFKETEPSQLLSSLAEGFKYIVGFNCGPNMQVATGTMVN